MSNVFHLNFNVKANLSEIVSLKIVQDSFMFISIYLLYEEWYRNQVKK
jgi:hypothetical protein